VESSIASAVLFDPVPATTFVRFRAICTANSITRACSAMFSVGDSPVVPTGTIPSIPAAICRSISSPKALSSTFPLRNGVTKAV